MCTLYLSMVLDKYFIWRPDKVRVRWKESDGKEKMKEERLGTQHSATDVYVKILK